MSQPQPELVVAFLQLSQRGHRMLQPILPALVLQLHLLPYAPPPRFVSWDFWLHNPSDTSTTAPARHLTLVPPLSLHSGVASHWLWLTPPAFCELLLAQQLQISSGLCKPVNFSAIYWAAIMPDPKKSKC